MNCAVRHVVAGKEKTANARGEFPIPPQLLQQTAVTDDSPGETYSKVAHGIRITGMPGFKQSLSATQIHSTG